MDKPIRVLLVEDSEDDARLAIRVLQRAGLKVQHERVESAAAMRAALEREAWDAVISDYHMPGFTGLEALGILKASGLDLPFILISGSLGEESAVEALKAGAGNYVMKRNLGLLAPALENELKDARNRAAQREAQRRLSENEARFRSLTHLSSDWYWEQDTEFRFTGFSGGDQEGGGGKDQNRALGLRRWELPGVVPVSGDWAEHKALHKARKPYRDFEYQRSVADGGVRFVEASGEPIFDSSGHFTGYRGVATDITERKRAEEALRASEERFRSLSALSADWYWEQDQQFRFVDIGAEAGGRSLVQADDVGKTRWEIPGADLSAAQWAEHRAMLEKRLPFRDFEFGRTSADGVFRYVSISGMPMFDPEGRFKGYRGVGSDVTERKAAAEKIKRLNRVYAVLSGINALIVRVQTKEDLYRDACRVAVEAGGFRLAWLGVVDREVMRIDPVAWSGVGEGFMSPLMRFLDEQPAGKRGLAEQAACDGKAIISADMTRDPLVKLQNEAREHGLHALAALPLMSGGATIGVLALYASEAGFFDADEMHLLHRLADDISFALDTIEAAKRLKIETAERARAETSVRRLNRIHAVLSGINSAIVRVKTKQELFGEACRIAKHLGGFPIAWIGEVDRDAMQVRSVAGEGTSERFFSAIRMTLREDAPEGFGVIGQAIRDRKPIVSNNAGADPRITGKGLVEGDTRSLAVLPLVIGDQAIGVLVLHAEVAGFFDEAEMKLLGELAGDIAFALDHIGKAEKLDHLAYYDALTGLANRTLFHERLSQYVRAAQQRDEKLALVLANLERFKTINSSLGRDAGDELLKQLAARLGRAADPANVARIGADQFAIVLPEVRGRSAVARRIEQIWHDCFVPPFRVADTELRMSAKAGIALFPNDGADADRLFADAEAALQNARQTGERHVFHSREMTASVADDLKLENRLRQALENNEFVLHYQPKVDTESRRIVGVEALIRWQSPELGLVPPMKFIPLMEETGLILPAGAWALTQASLDHRKWLALGLKAPRVAVNVSPIQLRQRDFVRSVEEAIIEGVAPTGIDLEITESLIMEDIQGNIEKLKAVRALGVNIAIDDFGTGYSSLGYLTRLPVQSLKIDRSFIITMQNDSDTMTLVSTIISLAHSLRLKVVAEGVDAEDQAKFLRLLRCEEMQGYLFSKPVPFDQMTTLLAAGAIATQAP